MARVDTSPQIFPEQAQVANALASLTLQCAAQAIEERGSFTVALAGGSLIKLLGGLKGKAEVDWANWHVFWVDERCVPHDDPESNYGGAMKALLADVPIPASQLYAIEESLCQSNEGAAEPCAAEYDARLKGLSSAVLPVNDGLPVFDLLLLGFGPDGHICSLFPEHPLLKVTEPWILPIADSPKPPPERITFSLPVVNAARKKCFTAIGEGKAEMAAKIIKSPGDESSIPASFVKGDVVWLMDALGASLL
jgi:6-phosphogluconolactonase|eukprot:TRINITY_DN43534_c0_g1_i1.p1 TRINITY_DN43534_c0_g1~~TRINITY_DN43534_c0_g1_i1.p1  ORF type:complete len:282 (+),score=44.43 TRINITY_DN43534_c0_g1_i1:95-847(+)